jgi:hypothetical protein
MPREGAIRLVWYLAWVFLWTLVFRGLLSLGVKLMARWWPETMDALRELERYGWWIGLVFGALVASVF